MGISYRFLHLLNKTRCQYFQTAFASSWSSAEGMSDIANMAENKSYVDEVVNKDLVCWRDRLDKSIPISKNMKGGNFVQLSTIDQNGHPRCRTLVFRGFVDIQGKEAIRMMTDSRSDKVAQLNLSNNFEFAWWFPLSNEQYRISGHIELVDSSSSQSSKHIQARLKQWQDISPLAKEQFFKPETPGDVFIEKDNDDETHSAEDVHDDDDLISKPPDNFILMLLWPKEVKYLRLTDRYAQLDQLNEDASLWNSIRMNP